MPPQRYRIVERGGRLEVIDLVTGARPPSAAERMAAHDAAHGHKALSYDRLIESEKDDQASAAAPSVPVPGPVAQRPAAPANATRDALAQRNSPWHNKGGATRPQLAAQSNAEAQARPGPMAKMQQARAAPRAGKGRQTIVTGKWWDSKGPRTISLGDAGRAKLSNGFVTGLVIGFFVLVALLIIQPVLLLVAGFVLFRFGSMVLAPLGSRIIDDAIKADSGPI